MWDILLSAAVDAGVGLMASAGFEDELKQLTMHWTGADARARRSAFDEAVERAFAGLGDATDQEKVRSLVAQPHVRDEIIAGLLNPVTSFDVGNLADTMGARFPQQARALRRFFANLEMALLQDERWGPILERFQDLRFREDVVSALQEQKRDLSPRQVVQELGVRLAGSGAIAQGDGAVAAGEGGIAVGGNVENVAENVVQIFIHELTLPRGPSTLPDDATLHQRYLQHVANQTGILRGLDYASADPSTHVQMKLADIYINLNTTRQVQIDGKDTESKEHARESRRMPRDLDTDELLMAQADGETRPLPALEAFIHNPHMILLGAPGSGKSTFVNHLTYCLASQGLHPDGELLARLPGWPEERQRTTPVRVVLRELAAWIQTTTPDQQESGLFTTYLGYWLAQNAMADFSRPLVELLHSGSGLLLFDGLDEVPVDAELRTRIRQMIEAVGETFFQCPILVTSRVLSYREEKSAEAGWQLDKQRWADFELAAFSAEKIESFIQIWYQQLQQLGQIDDAGGRSQRLLQAVRRPDLWRLAGTPLLLTVMAMVHARNNELPDARALLYEEVVDLLLWRWEAIKIRSKDGQETDLRQLLAEANLKDIDLKQLLWETAFEVHDAVRDKGSEATADIPETTLLRGLQRLHPDDDLNWADQMVEIVKQRAGLLVEDVPGVYSFPHRTFQEYLAACYLSNLGDFGEQGSQLAVQGVFWQEVLLLAVGRLIHSGDTDKPLVLLSHLCAAAEAGETDETTWSKVWRAGEVLVDIGLDRANRRPLGALMISQVQTHLTTLITEDHLSPRERAEAGGVLAQIGDPRDFDEMIEIPAGPFTMGSTSEEIGALIKSYETEKEWWEAEGPQHEVELPTFWISKYPVTNLQYARFVKATGHRAPRHWDGDQPPRQLLTHPVYYVSWHDAVAYCEWWTQKTGRNYRLPTEAEWEKAARGADDTRVYPWGNTFDATFCNMAETGIDSTSPVGIFKAEGRPYECLDMVGNVWEWTNSLYKAYPYKSDDGREVSDSDESRALRGGAWSYYGLDVRCAVRDHIIPTNVDGYVGFRLVSPGS